MDPYRKEYAIQDPIILGSNKPLLLRTQRTALSGSIRSSMLRIHNNRNEVN